MMKRKKGSHVGVIISFVIFVTFLIFLYLIIEPTITSQRERAYLLDYVEQTLVNYFTTNITTVTVQTDPGFRFVPPNKDCLKFVQVDPAGVFGFENNHLFVKNSTGADIGYSWISSEGHLLVENNDANTFFKVYASLGIDTTPTNFNENGCLNVQKTSYIVGSTTSQNDIFEQRIINATEAYKTNYTAFKQVLGLSPGTEFGFDFIYTNGTTISTGEVIQRTSVYAREDSINYLDTNLSSNSGRIMIRVW